MRLVAWMCFLGLVGSPAAGFADVFAYEQDNGTRAFTDKLERVPAKYKAKVQRRADPKLWDYPRTTITVVKPRTADPGARTYEPPRQPPVEEEALVSDAGTRRTMIIEPVRGFSIPVEVEAGEPVRVERTYRWVGGRYMPVVIVRQGERVLAEINEEASR